MFPQKPGPLSLKIFISWVPSYNGKYRCGCVPWKAQSNCHPVFRVLFCHFKRESVSGQCTVSGKKLVLAPSLRLDVFFWLPEMGIFKSEVPRCQPAPLGLFVLASTVVAHLVTNIWRPEMARIPVHCTSQSELRLARNRRGNVGPRPRPNQCWAGLGSDQLFRMPA